MGQPVTAPAARGRHSVRVADRMTPTHLHRALETMIAVWVPRAALSAVHRTKIAIMTSHRRQPTHTNRRTGREPQTHGRRATTTLRKNHTQRRSWPGQRNGVESDTARRSWTGMAPGSGSTFGLGPGRHARSTGMPDDCRCAALTSCVCRWSASGRLSQLSQLVISRQVGRRRCRRHEPATSSSARCCTGYAWSTGSPRSRAA